jgi:hypothetical protein
MFRDLSDVAVALGNHAEVFLANLLAGGGVLWLPTLWRQLGDGRGAERPLEVLLIRALSACVGVHLGVDDNDIDILAAGQDVVETAEITWIIQRQNQPNIVVVQFVEFAARLGYYL